MSTHKPNLAWRPGNAWLGLAHRASVTIEGGETKVGLFPARGLIGVLLGMLAVIGYATLRTLGESLRSDRCSFVKRRTLLLARLAERTAPKGS